jgi:hypothetical protein
VGVRLLSIALLALTLMVVLVFVHSVSQVIFVLAGAEQFAQLELIKTKLAQVLVGIAQLLTSVLVHQRPHFVQLGATLMLDLPLALYVRLEILVIQDLKLNVQQVITNPPLVKAHASLALQGAIVQRVQLKLWHVMMDSPPSLSLLL